MSWCVGKEMHAMKKWERNRSVAIRSKSSLAPTLKDMWPSLKDWPTRPSGVSPIRHLVRASARRRSTFHVLVSCQTLKASVASILYCRLTDGLQRNFSSSSTYYLP
ncbi:unnamed protein product [Protopolystoma xenopodis]|uniref:Uncharacterized protein n=1 Tax=Protopolystoma xenopodis TaxID=117903 RepID=A0A448WRS7_9PLAT|nr:unnamed protein product [Protopolystoma xenopodis]